MSIETIRIRLWKQDPVYFDVGTVNQKIQRIHWGNLKAEPLAHAMSQVNRFMGQTDRPFSVAEHSVNLRNLVNEKYHSKGANRAALLHDFPECLGINDLHTRVKRLLAPAIREAEERIMRDVWDMLGDSWTDWPIMEHRIKPYDSELGDYEDHCLFEPQNATITSVGVLKFGNPYMLPAHVAEELWLAAWREDNS